MVQSSNSKLGDGRKTNNPRALGVGRAKGTPNKVSGELKEMILQALDGAGGVEYLKRQATENPGPFMSLVGKVLPLTIKGDGEDGVIRLSWMSSVKP